MEEQKKFCKFCGESIDMSCVVCPKCGKQVENISSNPNPNVVINNTNMSQNVNGGFYLGKPKNKWISFCLCPLGLGHARLGQQVPENLALLHVPARHSGKEPGKGREN